MIENMSILIHILNILFKFLGKIQNLNIYLSKNKFSERIKFMFLIYTIPYFIYLIYNYIYHNIADFMNYLVYYVNRQIFIASNPDE